MVEDTDDNWRRVPIRRELYTSVEGVVTGREDLGYGSVARFVEDAVRRRVEEIYRDQGTTF